MILHSLVVIFSIYSKKYNFYTHRFKDYNNLQSKIIHNTIIKKRKKLSVKKHKKFLSFFIFSNSSLNNSRNTLNIYFSYIRYRNILNTQQHQVFGGGANHLNEMYEFYL